MPISPNIPDPALEPAMYGLPGADPNAPRDDRYWKSRYESLLDSVTRFVNSPNTPMTVLADLRLFLHRESKIK